MFDQNGLEEMLARLRSKSDAGIFWHVFALAQHGKRPCACLIKMCWKRSWHVLACCALAQHGKRPCACLIKFCWKRCWHVYVLKAMLACFGMFWHVSLWPNMGRGLVHVL